VLKFALGMVCLGSVYFFAARMAAAKRLVESK